MDPVVVPGESIVVNCIDPHEAGVSVHSFASLTSISIKT